MDLLAKLEVPCGEADAIRHLIQAGAETVQYVAFWTNSEEEAAAAGFPLTLSRAQAAGIDLTPAIQILTASRRERLSQVELEPQVLRHMMPSRPRKANDTYLPLDDLQRARAATDALALSVTWWPDHGPAVGIEGDVRAQLLEKDGSLDSEDRGI